MSMLPCYRLRFTRDPSVPSTTPDFESCLHTFSARRNSPAIVAHPIAAPPVDVTDPSERNGSIPRDKRRSPTHEWNSLDEFKTWRMKEQLDHRIELLLVRTFSASSSLAPWHEKRIYVCSRQGTGGKSKSIRKRLERVRSRPSNRTGCRCRVIVKTYPHTSTVFGWYRAEHDHATGILNLGFMRLQDTTRAYAPGLLQHMKPKEVLMRVRSEHSEHKRHHYITILDIHRIQKTIKQEGSVARPISSSQPSYERSKESPAEVEELLFPEDVCEAGSSQMDEKPEVSDKQSNRCADPGTPMSPTLGPISHQVSTLGVTANAESTPISVNGKTYHHLPAHLAALPPLIPPRHSSYHHSPESTPISVDGKAYNHLPARLATQAAGLPPLIPPQRSGRHHSHQIPVSAPTVTSAPVISSAIHSAPAPTPVVMPASHVIHNIVPPVPLPHDASVPYYTPQPLIVYMLHPPYQMIIYPVYPVHYPPPNI